jgi:hypothetical protein
MSTPKKKSLSVRIAPHLLEALKKDAALKVRSVTNHVEFLIAENCPQQEIPPLEPIEKDKGVRLESVARRWQQIKDGN